ncbi:PorP/SprF family type IX secretion system membrane protein [Haliscomenobacter hydrossis]|uniref:Membrane protein n=1 Tax=Haliscomenobacter hydrossis (strain ATCC 27775 / DSM 1100 / LMG 10767 / O) TaxID=760192 RepID=F4KS44_HALH1|nr:PorP/SprF family type IX secretion system membrane protein [Haliscomenobacter hydrossis]AEE52289.1 putative membrane protein [Haliscomenobacter hydrossis DSM 1100]
MYQSSLLILLITACSVTMVCGQQLPAYSFYRDHWGLVNPAGVSSNFIAFQKKWSVNASMRHQWTQIPEAPKTQVITFEYIADDDMDETFSLIAGGHLLNDKAGAFGQTGAYAHTACRWRAGKNSLVAGFNLGGVQYRANLAEILSGTSATENISESELEALSASNTFNLDVGAGVMLYLGDYSSQTNYYFGLSIPQTFKRSIALGDNSQYVIERVPHIYLSAGVYLFGEQNRENDNHSFTEISLWSRYLPNAPISVEGSVRHHLEQAFWFGVGGGTSQMMRLELGVDVNDDPMYRLSLGYNQSFSKVRNFFGQTFEASFSYAW